MTQLISDHAALCFIGCLPISWRNFTTCVLSSIWFTPLRLILSLGANVCNIIACTQAACRQNSSAGYILTHPMWSSWFAKALAALQPVFLLATSAFHDVFFSLLSRHHFCKERHLSFWGFCSAERELIVKNSKSNHRVCWILLLSRLKI